MSGTDRTTGAQRWIRDLGLARHPEGGWFREVYRAAQVIPRSSLPEGFSGDRTYSTAIYFLLEGHDLSALHRLKQDELWHHYDGGRLTIHTIDPNGRYARLRLGRQINDGEAPMGVVPAGWWFGAVTEPDAYALVGCTVAPGFDFADFEMADRAELLRRFPEHRSIIQRLTR